jgi:hypothetical protein
MQLFKPPADSVRGRIFNGPEAAPAPAAPVGPLWQPVPDAAPKPPPRVPIPNEAALLAACTTPIDPDDGHRAGNDKKEQQLAALFDRLAALEALTLAKRLGDPQPADALAKAFENRLSIDRRKRLVAYLGSAKRRAALCR